MPVRKLVLEDIEVESFTMERPAITEMPTSITGIDSTCPCCDTRPDLC